MKPERRREGRSGNSYRRVYFREPVQSFLIVCEGEKTEKLYFEAFKVPKDVRGIDVFGMGRSTLSLVEKAIKIKDEADEKYDQVWCVFDVEDYPAADVHAAMALAHRNKIRVAISNQAFELWYLLHFNFYHVAMDRQGYWDKLTRLLGFQYDKNTCIYAQLIDRQDTALRHARQLLQQYQPYDPARNDPSTSVHFLVEELNRFSPEARAAQGI
jgi:hypothetical protein